MNNQVDVQIHALAQLQKLLPHFDKEAAVDIAVRFFVLDAEINELNEEISNLQFEAQELVNKRDEYRGHVVS